jgi:gliding motility-associated-like protein
MKPRFAKIFSGLMLLLPTMASLNCFSQNPTINFIDRTTGANGDVVTITGDDFGNDRDNLVISFGAENGTIKTASDQLIEATVPAGATFGNISITNTASGLTGNSNDQFLLSFNGAHGFQIDNLEGQKDFESQKGLYDFCLCDFDGDHKPDILATSEVTGTVTLLTNTTTNAGIDNISFNRVPILINARSLHARCGDLNGDGKPDAIFSESDGDKIFILQNTSTGTGIFSFTTTFTQLSGIKVKRLEIADLDHDGKPEIIVTNQRANTVSILVNSSTKETIRFPNTNVKNVTIPGVVNDRGFDGLVVKDLNNDKYPEIVTTQFQRESDLYVIPNNSTPGNIAMGTVKSFPLTNTVVTLKVGDLDNDGKPDIAATLLLGASIAIFKNESTTENFSFAAPVLIETDRRPYGLDMGDLDGDGKIDIAVSSIIETSITILNNESAPGNFSFTKIPKSVTYINRHLAINDIDGDGKPDIAFTSIDDNNGNIPASKMSVLRNKHCMIPVLYPDGPHKICTGSSLDLYTTQSLGLSYSWKNNGELITTTGEASFDVNVPGNFAVTTTSAVDAACIATSNTIEVTFEVGASLPEMAVITPVDPVCEGSQLQLHVSDVGATAYKWRGPENYSATGLNPTRPEFQNIFAGRYVVEVYAGECLAQETSIPIAVLESPEFKLNASETAIVCEETNKKLIVSPQPNDFAYQWYEKSRGALSGETNTSLIVSEEGEYFVKASTEPACASGESPATRVVFAATPQADFSSPAIGCKEQEMKFTNETVADGRLPLFYEWNFGDEGTSQEESPVHTYQSPSTFSVTLNVTYEDGVCPNQFTQNISVESTPNAAIVSETNTFNICAAGELKLALQSDFHTYAWSTGETTSTISVSQEGTYSVTVTTVNGCIAEAEQAIGSFPSPTVTVLADPVEITEGESAQLIANGLVTYNWQPVENLSDPISANPVANPIVTTLYKVEGRDANGCAGQGEVELKVKGDLATKKIVPSKFFSPGNGDDINKYWSIEKILNYPRCKVSIYDEKGIKVFEAKPYLNDWDGTYNGKLLPDGVYFYIVQCDGEENSPKTGTITMLR